MVILFIKRSIIEIERQNGNSRSKNNGVPLAKRARKINKKRESRPTGANDAESAYEKNIPWLLASSALCGRNGDRRDKDDAQGEDVGVFCDDDDDDDGDGILDVSALFGDFTDVDDLRLLELMFTYPSPTNKTKLRKTPFPTSKYFFMMRVNFCTFIQLSQVCHIPTSKRASLRDNAALIHLQYVIINIHHSGKK